VFVVFLVLAVMRIVFMNWIKMNLRLVFQISALTQFGRKWKK